MEFSTLFFDIILTFFGLTLIFGYYLVVGYCSWKIADYVKDKGYGIGGALIAMLVWCAIWISIPMAIIKNLSCSS